MTDRGVCYLLCGVSYAERLLVSLYSLRRHWSGPVRLFVTDADSEAVGRRIASDGRLGVDVEAREPYRHRRHGDYCTKTLVPSWSPFKRSVFLDADTAVADKIDELFEAPLALVQFSEWQTQGKIMAARVKDWEKVNFPAVKFLVKRALEKSWPAINTGIYAWHRGHHFARAWHKLTVAGEDRPLTDELAMQLLAPSLEPYAVLTDRFNCSPYFGVHKPPAIWHFHGSKHLRKSQGREIWEPIFWDALAKNSGGLTEWAGDHDKWVAELLREKGQRVDSFWTRRKN